MASNKAKEFFKLDKFKDFVKNNKIVVAVVAVLLILCIGCLTGYGVLAIINSEREEIVLGRLQGEGTIDDPYIIATKADLLEFNKNAGNYYNYSSPTEIGHTKLMNDINLGGMDWLPIGSESSEFFYSGSFDGNGHTISNCNIVTKGYQYVGFFGDINDDPNLDTTIQNLTLTGIKIKTSEDHLAIGGLVGLSCATILNCDVTANISIYGDVDTTGGIVGSSFGEVSNCTSNGSLNVSVAEMRDSGVYKSNLNFGGVVGQVQQGGKVGGLTNNMAVNVSLISAMRDAGGGVSIRTGGVVGQALNSAIYSNLINTANINGVGIVGGIIGDLNCSGATVQYIKNSGSVYSTSGLNMEVGGIVGRSNLNATNTIIDCYNEGAITAKSILYDKVEGSSFSAGIVGTGKVKVENCKSSGEIKITGERANNVGGIIGGSYGSVKNSYCSGNITIDSEVAIVAGGIVGVMQKAEGQSINFCYYSGIIIGKVGFEEKGVTIGGIMGYNHNEAGTTIKNNYYDRKVVEDSFVDNYYVKPTAWYGLDNKESGYTGTNIADNVGEVTAELQGKPLNGFVEFDVDNAGSADVWIFASNAYPKLYWEHKTNFMEW